MLERFLAEKREVILKRWLDVILETYPADTRSFLTSKKGPFTNPVGHTLKEGINSLFSQLLQGGDFQEASKEVDKLIRLRAVQDVSPSEAVGFIFALKGIVREELGAKAEVEPEGLEELNARIDRMGLMAFDLYSACREKLYEIRVNEIRRRTERLLKMAGFTYEVPQQEGELGEPVGP